MLLPATPGFTMSGFEPVKPVRIDPKTAAASTGEVRHGTRGGRPDVRLLGGYFVFDSPDAALLVSLLPALVHVRGVERLSMLVRLVGDESSDQRSGRDLVLTRLVEVLLIEALRSTLGRGRAAGAAARPGRCAARAGDSRRCTASSRVRGRWPSSRRRPRCRARRSSSASRAPSACRRWSTCSPGAWPSRRICCAARTSALAEVAERVGYGSASTFSTAFSRHVGQPPGRYARAA